MGDNEGDDDINENNDNAYDSDDGGGGYDIDESGAAHISPTDFVTSGCLNLSYRL